MCFSPPRDHCLHREDEKFNLFVLEQIATVGLRNMNICVAVHETESGFYLDLYGPLNHNMCVCVCVCVKLLKGTEEVVIVLLSGWDELKWLPYFILLSFWQHLEMVTVR